MFFLSSSVVVCSNDNYVRIQVEQVQFILRSIRERKKERKKEEDDDDDDDDDDNDDEKRKQAKK
jgi:hypothetical protein